MSSKIASSDERTLFDVALAMDRVCIRNFNSLSFSIKYPFNELRTMSNLKIFIITELFKNIDASQKCPEKNASATLYS